MAAYHTASGNSQPPRPDERVPTPHLPVMNAAHEVGPVRDLPMPGHPQPTRRTSGSYYAPREEVRIPDIGRTPTPSDRMNMDSNLPPMSMRYKEERPRMSPSHAEYRYEEEKEKEDEKRPFKQPSVDEDYDESAADALLSMGNPQLGTKRAIPQDAEDSKRPKGEEKKEEVKEEEKEEESA
ncbi:hypothetical protein BY458DRAFT_495468 [Sporodiniella umbellata]|nr:hypothetical protein BY458DRAFT_495468 [Sporodiniella umbellata]